MAWLETTVMQPTPSSCGNSSVRQSTIIKVHQFVSLPSYKISQFISRLFDLPTHEISQSTYLTFIVIHPLVEAHASSSRTLTYIHNYVYSSLSGWLAYVRDKSMAHTSAPGGWPSLLLSGCIATPRPLAPCIASLAPASVPLRALPFQLVVCVGFLYMNSYNSWVTLPSRWGPSPVRSLFAGTSDPGGALQQVHRCVDLVKSKNPAQNITHPTRGRVGRPRPPLPHPQLLLLPRPSRLRGSQLTCAPHPATRRASSATASRRGRLRHAHAGGPDGSRP